MPDIAPSLVEAAARALRRHVQQPTVWDTDIARETLDRNATTAAKAVIDAVGDALRLEGAEALWSNEPPYEGMPGPSRVRSDAPTMYGQGVTDGYRAGREQGRLEGAQAEHAKHQPDISPGDVIHAEPDGTIVLDDGITTWNPSRAAEYLVKAERERIVAAIKAIAMDEYMPVELMVGEYRRRVLDALGGVEASDR